AWDSSIQEHAIEKLRFSKIPWLRGFVSFGEGVIGPLVRDGKAGCFKCADYRRLMGGRDRREMRELEQRLAKNGGTKQDVWASKSGLLQMAYLIGAEVQRVIDGKEANFENRVFLMNLKTMKSSSHTFLP
ncbi:bacteriocin biosynthesis protein SagD, partial [Pseudomonas sp. FW305-BF6]|uniref:TOMM precursor leader peptide-binding protein n=1 Tax=Pseudomonas sp. FW305-BF6 TaxID=2070673 RepID=UPI000CA93CB1